MTKSAPAADYESLDDDDLLDAVVEEFTAVCRTGAHPQPAEFAAATIFFHSPSVKLGLPPFLGSQESA